MERVLFVISEEVVLAEEQISEEEKRAIRGRLQLFFD